MILIAVASAQAQSGVPAPFDRAGGDPASSIAMWSTSASLPLKGEQATESRTLYVDDDASQDPGLGDPTLSDPVEDGTDLHPFDAIQEAIDAGSDGDTVVVEDGIYAGTGNRDIDFHGKALIVRSRNGPAACIIDCGGSEEDPHRGVYFHSRETPNAVLHGFTIKHGFVAGNGNWETRQGGGVLVLYSSPVIQLCVFTENTASWSGGGIYCSEQTVVRDCTVTRNRAGAGGGIYCGMGSPLIRGNVISENVAEQDGGGVSCFERARVIGNTIIANRAALGGGISSYEDYPASIVGNVIRNNWAEQGGGGISLSWDHNTLVFGNLIAENSTNGLGGGILLSTDPADIVNNTIVNNWASKGGGIYGGWGNVANCIIWGNSDGIASYDTEDYPFCTVAWSCTQNDMPGEGNIRIDPSFIEGEGDYRLRSDSPCIDAGRTGSIPADTFDLDGDGNTAEPVPFDLIGDTRVSGAAVDMGAYEFPADCNGNGVPDNRDIAGGASSDCNANGIPDECDIQTGHSPDVDGDGVPDECELQPCQATRTMPVAYAPGLTMTVAIRVELPTGAAAYAVEDVPPTGWVVGAVSDGGTFDTANGKVKWGPYSDNQGRTLRYEVTPPTGAEGQACFGPGVISMDGTTESVCGSPCIESCPVHPADANKDRRLVIEEVTTYAACWKRGCTWPVPPNPIPIGLMTRAGYLWRNGENYCCDPKLPVLWINCPREDEAPTPAQAGMASAAARSLRIGEGNSLVISIAVARADAAAYAVEETPPAGWSVNSINENGYFDGPSGIVRWGPFFDNQDRTLTYVLKPSAVTRADAMLGKYSADGYDSGIAGIQIIPGFAPADFDRDYDVDRADFEHLKACSTGAHVPQGNPDCVDADLDGDSDVDQSDFGLFQRCLTGEQMMADPNCAR